MMVVASDLQTALVQTREPFGLAQHRLRGAVEAFDELTARWPEQFESNEESCGIRPVSATFSGERHQARHRDNPT
jgi:hypothetical protein